MIPTQTTRDIVVIGCSAGGVEALPRVLQQLPPDLAAAIFIVQHMGPSHAPLLAGILERTSRLPVAWAEQGARIQPGRVLVAPPDFHLLLAEDHIQLIGGPRENHARPSIDKLFRSAAAAYGSRVVGVLLTGMMSDGVAGLRAIRDAGGEVLVQDPTTAAFPELPERAIASVRPARVLTLDAIGAAIGSLVDLGHVTTASEMLDASALEVESALWSAVRALNDRATTLETLAQDARRIGSGQASEIYGLRARESREQAEIARRFMLDLARTK